MSEIIIKVLIDSDTVKENPDAGKREFVVRGVPTYECVKAGECYPIESPEDCKDGVLVTTNLIDKMDTILAQQDIFFKYGEVVCPYCGESRKHRDLEYYERVCECCDTILGDFPVCSNCGKDLVIILETVDDYFERINATK